MKYYLVFGGDKLYWRWTDFIAKFNSIEDANNHTVKYKYKIIKETNVK